MTRAALLLLSLGGPLLSSCGDGESRLPSDRPPENWDTEVPLAEAVDVDQADDHVEVHLTAGWTDATLVSAGPTKVAGYNGQLAGPLIVVEKGQTLSVHFSNELSEASTLHFHGMRLPIGMDGVPGISQHAVQPGEHFAYSFVAQDAGLYWYHPHVEAAGQVGSGLYGPILVTDPNEPSNLGDELVLVLSDISVSESDAALLPRDQGGDLGSLFGREGNVVLVNGRINPLLHARSGRRQRWRVLNAARSRYFQLSVPGHELTRIGSDGGLLTEAVVETMTVIAPAERVDVLVTPRGEPETEVQVASVPFEHGFGSTFNRANDNLFRIDFTDDAEPAAEAQVPRLQRSIEPFDAAGARLVDMDLTLSNVDGTVSMGINGLSFKESVPLSATVGDRDVWTIRNTFDFAHPFHLHGFFFQILDEDLNPIQPLAWKDTLNIGVDGLVRIGIRYDDSPGMWMFHCHILDHAELGMMGVVDVRRPGDAGPTLGAGIEAPEHEH